MNRREALGVLGASTILVSCASGGSLSSVLPGANGAPEEPVEQFSYAPASDEYVRASVQSVVMRGDNEFIPSDPNWLQVHLTLANASGQTIRLEDVKGELPDGVVIPSASSAAELLEPPSFTREIATTVGLGAAGMAGMMLFPLAGVVAGAAIVGRNAFRGDRMQRTVQALQRTALQPGSIAPGTSIAGNIFIPAVRGQVGLIVFYSIDGHQRSIRIRRNQ